MKYSQMILRASWSRGQTPSSGHQAQETRRSRGATSLHEHEICVVRPSFFDFLVCKGSHIKQPLLFDWQQKVRDEGKSQSVLRFLAYA